MSAQKKFDPLLAAAIAVAVLMFVPGGEFVLIPLRYLNTLVHESGHAIAALASGGSNITITLDPDGSGLTRSLGGWQLLVSPAGYIGATIAGGVLLAAGRKSDSARFALLGLGIAMAVATLIWVRNVFGWVIGVPLSMGLILAGNKLKGDHLMFLARSLGIIQCLESLRAIRDLIYLNSVGHEHNDAAILAQSTGIPPMVWAVLWGLVSLAVIGFTISAERKRR
jgi:hypothetical protein